MVIIYQVYEFSIYRSGKHLLKVNKKYIKIRDGMQIWLLMLSKLTKFYFPEIIRKL